jgi:hypothetical protein
VITVNDVHLPGVNAEEVWHEDPREVDRCHFGDSCYGVREEALQEADDEEKDSSIYRGELFDHRNNLFGIVCAREAVII